MEGTLSSEAAREILVRGARVLADDGALGPSLETLLVVIAEQLDIESAAIVVAGRRPDHLAIVAATGLGDPALAGLTEALRNPAHPIARTLGHPVPSFDVLPSQPGGPALRSHLPLTVTRNGTDHVLGVLALAHHHPLGAEPRELLEAAARLAAVAIERQRPI
jgi:GAF domain-containing protein